MRRRLEPRVTYFTLAKRIKRLLDRGEHRIGLPVKEGEAPARRVPRVVVDAGAGGAIFDAADSGK